MSEDNVKTLQQKALRADERARMLQEAEMKALAKTDLFKKLDAQTKDPVREAFPPPRDTHHAWPSTRLEQAHNYHKAAAVYMLATRTL